MKLIEAMKNLKTIEKRIQKNAEQIEEYCAYVSTETPQFETHERQQKEVAQLIQANLDLQKEYLRLKRAIETTNLETVVTVEGQEHTISELITLRRTAGKFALLTFSALRPNKAIGRLQQVYSKNVDATNPARVIPAYREEDKNAALRKWDNFLSAIDGRLEVVNAETDLKGY